MDRSLIANKLGVENLKNYIIEEISIGKKEAETAVEEVFNTSFEEIENIEQDNVRVIRILSEILKNKTDLSLLSTDFLTQMISGNQDKSKYKFSKPIENEELADLADYILDYLDFNSTSNIMVRAKLTSLRNDSLKYHAATTYIFKCKSLFDILNDKCKLDKFSWQWSNFEEGIRKVLLQHGLDIISIKSDCELKIQLLEGSKRFDIDDLKTKIEYLKRDIIDLKNENERIIDFYNKYYYNSQVLIQTTYFGDNLPFLLNLFNFFKQNNMLSNGWSYFYNCMAIGNIETVSLTTSKKLNFVGRIFYHLGDYLTLHYKDDSFKFLQSKFLINDKSFSDNFRTNHMKTTYDKNDYPELIAIDDFFENQKKIYIKM